MLMRAAISTGLRHTLQRKAICTVCLSEGFSRNNSEDEAIGICVIQAFFLPNGYVYENRLVEGRSAHTATLELQRFRAYVDLA
jgi:hypothetical protein